MKPQPTELLMSIRDFAHDDLKKIEPTIQHEPVVSDDTDPQSKPQLSASPLPMTKVISPALKVEDYSPMPQTHKISANVWLNIGYQIITSKPAKNAALALGLLYLANEMIDTLGYTGVAVGAATVAGGAYYAYKNVPMVKRLVDNKIDRLINGEHSLSQRSVKM